MVERGTYSEAVATTSTGTPALGLSWALADKCGITTMQIKMARLTMRTFATESC